ncbi:5-oxoprolinase subunit C family protein [Roseinatronobacter bogoriensis]|uniref:Urea amidolyase n=1 Tax=Roseinatronobacter bogoriensis subsp. barguzinensis TaxID=441209 RepID=A0A2K8KH78_9RHOB|nr:biotin-dependent carboxyltransferase family protein [Rhodobaca bogoriensis]ATX67135.1 urea amidolyase [Rhodobaca barguzinensis]MBB4206657.1 allophanate hydrolase [Rhodobaca bogoriensis DSM 18756]TDW41401.1 allophanate hydrolase subunit 2 [Rhodobaca barguzinensis]TDY74421.1 allophanate hydrolase subunit 2 [Rhodobaca bogoriensis DSM 18756]
MRKIYVHRAGPGVTVQDLGREGWLSQGLSRGGAADRLALAEGAALLHQPTELAALEIAGSFLNLEVSAPVRIALTGAPMRAVCDGAPLVWNASHALPGGARLELSGSEGGYSYVHFGGGIDAPVMLGARSAHLAAKLGRMLVAQDSLALGPDSGSRTGMTFTPLPRFNGGLLRLVETPQTRLFSPEQRSRFTQTAFRKDARANRMGQRLVCPSEGFGADTGLSILSETIVPGDVQITGDGAPFVLLSECQTTGGYPRIGTVLPCDLPRLVQAPAHADLHFAFVSMEDAIALERAEADRRDGLGRALRPLIRNLHDIPDLLAYQLVSGVTRGDELEGCKP